MLDTRFLDDLHIPTDSICATNAGNEYVQYMMQKLQT